MKSITESNTFKANPANSVVWGKLRKAHGVHRTQVVKPLFTLSRVVATPGALTAIAKLGKQSRNFLALQASDSWGKVTPENIKENELSLQDGFRRLSAYRTNTGEKLG